MTVKRTSSSIGWMVISVFVLVVVGSPLVVQAAGTESDDSEEKATQSVYQQGVDRANEGQYEEALSLFKKALKQEPKNPEVLNMLAFSQRKTGKVDQAIENYKKALSIRPRFPEAREYLGEAYLQAALEQLKTLEQYGTEGEEQYRELKQAIAEAAGKIDSASGESQSEDDSW